MADVSGESRYELFLTRAVLAADIIAGLVFAVLFVTIVAQTGMRYLFRMPLTTSQELATISFIWLVFWCIGCNLSTKDHVRFDLIYSLVPEGSQRVMSLVCHGAFLGVFAYAAKDTYNYFIFLERQYTASMTISYQWAFLPYFIFFAVFPVRLAITIARLLGPRWKKHL